MNASKRAAIELSQLKEKKQIASNLKERASVQADKIYAIKSSLSDDPVKASNSNDKVAELLSVKEQLQKECNAAEHEVQMIEQGIKQLAPDLQLVISAFYIKYPKHSGRAVNYLCEELNINERNVWKKKKKALEQYARLQGFM